MPVTQPIATSHIRSAWQTEVLYSVQETVKTTAYKAPGELPELQTVVTQTPTPSVAPAVPVEATSYYEQWIFNEESGNNPEAINISSGACGIGQALPCSKMPCSLSDYNCQVSFFTDYMLERYGSWYAAYEFHIANGYW